MNLYALFFAIKEERWVTTFKLTPQGRHRPIWSWLFWHSMYDWVFALISMVLNVCSGFCVASDGTAGDVGPGRDVALDRTAAHTASDGCIALYGVAAYAVSDRCIALHRVTVHACTSADIALNIAVAAGVSAGGQIRVHIRCLYVGIAPHFYVESWLQMRKIVIELDPYRYILGCLLICIPSFSVHNFTVPVLNDIEDVFFEILLRQAWRDAVIRIGRSTVFACQKKVGRYAKVLCEQRKEGDIGTGLSRFP